MSKTLDATPSDKAQHPAANAVETTGFLRSQGWWRLLGLSLGVGLLSTLGALAFVWLVDIGTDIVWVDTPTSAQLFSGSPVIVVIMTVAGIVVGLIHRFVPSAGDPDVFAAIVTGRLDPRPVPGGLLVALTTLIGGFSLGPEVPTGMLAGGTASAVGDRRGWDETTRKVTLGSSVGAAYGGLFTSPFVALMLLLELARSRSIMSLAFLVIQAAAALLGFAVFFVVGGFSGLLSSLSLPEYELHLWHFAAAAAIAVVAVGLGLLTAVFARLFRGLAAPLAKRVVLRGAVAGFGLGLLAMAVPLTLFYGASALPGTTSEAAEIGAAVLIISLVAKLAAMTAARSFGFIGGPIFPLVFAGAALGAAVNVIVPDIPVELAVTAGMAAVPAAVLPLPLSLGVLAVVIAGTSLELVAPALTASLLATTVVRGMRRVETPGGPS
jgi:H+/Cl- antiporter ClcA